MIIICVRVWGGGGGAPGGMSLLCEANKPLAVHSIFLSRLCHQSLPGARVEM